MGPFSSCLSVLTYHRILPEPDPLLPGEVCAAEFDWQLRTVGRWFRVLPLSEAVGRLRKGTLPVRAASITFDDGYANNLTVALPILRKHAMPATFFIATGFIEGGRMWNDTVIEIVRRARGAVLDARSAGLNAVEIGTLDLRRQAITRLLGAFKYLPQDDRQHRVEELHAAACCELPSGMMMTANDVRQIHDGGMEIGAHTVTHPILATLDSERAIHEMRESKRRLEEITGAPVTLFAYPNGKPARDYSREHVKLVQDLGFDGAVCTARGVAHGASDLFQLPRFTPWDRTPGKFLLRLLLNTFTTAPQQV